MDWIKQNKFLSGWIAVTLLGAAALGYLMFTAKGAHSTAQTDYESKVGELQALQGKAPYPDEENVKKMQDLQKAHQAAIEQLHADLAKTEMPLAPLSAVRFQDELRDSVRRVIAAAAGKMQLPAADKFYMAFDRYQAEPPKDEAAAPLGRMLKAMEKALEKLITSGAVQLVELKRDPLPEEGVERTTTTSAAPTPRPARGGADAGPELLKRQSFDISFIAAEPSFRTFLNEIVKSKEQFYIPRFIVLENEKATGPPKVAAGPGVPPPPPQPGTTGAAADDSIQMVVGEEKLKITMRIDVVDFADPAASTAKTAK